MFCSLHKVTFCPLHSKGEIVYRHLSFAIRSSEVEIDTCSFYQYFSETCAIFQAIFLRIRIWILPTSFTNKFGEMGTIGSRPNRRYSRYHSIPIISRKRLQKVDIDITSRPLYWNTILSIASWPGPYYPGCGYKSIDYIHRKPCGNRKASPVTENINQATTHATALHPAVMFALTYKPGITY